MGCTTSKVSPANAFADEVESAVKRASATGVPTRELCAKLEDAIRPLLSELEKEEDELNRKAAEHVQAAHTFSLVNADKIRECNDTTLPQFRELRRREGWVVEQSLRRSDAFQGHYREILAVSHRWLDRQAPDSQGVQFKAVRDFLIEHPQIRLVWYDFWCAPHHPWSTEEERIQFVNMSANVELLFLGSSVLILLDLSYTSRFWTQAEAWLSMLAVTPQGIRPAAAEERRFSIVGIYGASNSPAESLVSMWSGRTPEEAFLTLAKPDVLVTNQKDKDTLLPRIRDLDSAALETITALKWYELEPTTAGALRMVAHDRANHIIEKLEVPTNVIAIFGKVRTGKSYLMNALARLTGLFVVSANARSCTQGVDLSSRTVPCSHLGAETGGDIQLAFVDLEGQGDKGATYDMRLVAPMLLISKAIIINVTCAAGPPKDEILDNLASVMRATRLLHATTRSQHGAYGNLHVILRDCDNNEGEIHAMLFGLEEGAPNDHALSNRNDIRREISTVFESAPRVWCLPRLQVPVGGLPQDYAKLEGNNAANYKAKIRELRDVVGEQVASPKLLDGRPLTGPAIVRTLREAVDADEVAKKELHELKEAVQRDEAEEAWSFFFVEASFVRDFKVNFRGDSLPRFQELKLRGALELVKISKHDAYMAAHVGSVLVVSHRWETRGRPDLQSHQLEAIQAYLREHTEVKRVWYDYWCLPQGKDKTPAETFCFSRSLPHINMLYLGMQVLILLDSSYVGRFWTCYEAFLSMMCASTEGLRPAREGSRRYHIRLIHGANQALGQSLVDKWSACDAAQAHKELEKDDIEVTNQTDKDQQLVKLLTLERDIRDTLLFDA